MTGGTHAQRIVALLSYKPGLDDDVIAHELSITPRQTVNQVCRRLAAKGVLVRVPGAGGKIINRLADASAAAGIASPPRSERDGARLTQCAELSGASLCPDDLSKTLIIVPCSKSKRAGMAAEEQLPTLTESLPEALTVELRAARQKAADRIAVDEMMMVPALERYSGSLYQNRGREALRTLMEVGAHVIIISGGYGAVLGTEAIGVYEAALRPSWWPNGLLRRVLIAYALANGICSVRAFAAATSSYGRVLSSVPWSAAGIEDALLLMPEARPGGVRTSPASIGQALAALADRTLTVDWVSSYGLRLEVRR